MFIKKPISVNWFLLSIANSWVCIFSGVGYQVLFNHSWPLNKVGIGNTDNPAQSAPQNFTNSLLYAGSLTGNMNSWLTCILCVKSIIPFFNNKVS